MMTQASLSCRSTPPTYPPPRKGSSLISSIPWPRTRANSVLACSPPRQLGVDRVMRLALGLIAFGRHASTSLLGDDCADVVAPRLRHDDVVCNLWSMRAQRRSTPGDDDHGALHRQERFRRPSVTPQNEYSSAKTSPLSSCIRANLHTHWSPVPPDIFRYGRFGGVVKSRPSFCSSAKRTNSHWSAKARW
jgi:hypothetical protein